MFKGEFYSDLLMREISYVVPPHLLVDLCLDEVQTPVVPERPKLRIDDDLLVIGLSLSISPTDDPLWPLQVRPVASRAEYEPDGRAGVVIGAADQGASSVVHDGHNLNLMK